MRRNSIWIAGVLAMVLITPTVYGQRWESDEALAEAIERYRAIPYEQLNELSTPELLNAFIYRTTNRFPRVSADGLGAMYLLEQRTDLTANDVLAVLAEIRQGEVNDLRWTASAWGIVLLKDMAEFHGLFDPEQEPRANELLLGFAMRAIEYTVRQEDMYGFFPAYTFLLQSTIATLDRAGLVSMDLSLDFDVSREAYMRAFLEHFGIVTEIPRNWR